jgi:hypothetical protein
MKEHDLVVLTRGLDDHGLEAGDVGVVVHEYGVAVPIEGYEVEFVSATGDTIAVVTLSRDDLRPMGSSEILHVRSLVER